MHDMHPGHKQDAGAGQQPRRDLYHHFFYASSALGFTVWIYSIYSQSEIENEYIICRLFTAPAVIKQ